MATSQSPGKGFAWFGDAKGKGRWGIDTASDHWSDQDKSNFSYWDKQKTRKGPNLPGWFQGSYNPETGKAYGMNFSGGMGWLSQGGDLTAEHYGQPGSWSFTSHLRPDGSGRHTVGDQYWEGDWNKGTKQEGPDFYSKDPNYQTELADQKSRMRGKMVSDIQAGKGSAVDLYSWDKRYGQEDLAGGKHFTQDIKGEQAAASRQAQLAQQQQGVVRGGLETEQQNKGMTLAQRLASIASNTPTAIKDIFTTKGTAAGFTGMDKAGFDAITSGEKFKAGSGWKQILGEGAYSTGAKQQVPGFSRGASQYAGTQSSLGGVQKAGGIVDTVVPRGASNIPFLESQSKVAASTFDKGKALADDLKAGKYANSATANKLRSQFQKGVSANVNPMNAMKLGKSLAKGGASLGADLLINAAVDRWVSPQVNKAGQWLGEQLVPVGRKLDDWLPGMNSADERRRSQAKTKARGSTYNPNINRNILRIQN